MSQLTSLNKFKLKDFNLGYGKLQDGITIILRAAVVDIKPLTITPPLESNLTL